MRLVTVIVFMIYLFSDVFSYGKPSSVVVVENIYTITWDFVKVHSVPYNSPCYGEVNITYGMCVNIKRPHAVAYLTNSNGDILYDFTINPSGFQITSVTTSRNKISLLLAFYYSKYDESPAENQVQLIFYELPSGKFHREYKEIDLTGSSLSNYR